MEEYIKERERQKVISQKRQKKSFKKIFFQKIKQGLEQFYIPNRSDINKPNKGMNSLEPQIKKVSVRKKIFVK